MKKILITFFLTLMFCNPIFAESFYFKECKLSENTFGDYLINFEDNVVEATLFTADGQRQEINDKIKVVTEDQVVTEKIKSAKGQNLYFVYYLDAKSKSITKQMYKKDNNVDFFQPFGPKSRSYCLNVKADWDRTKIEAKQTAKEQKQILETKKKILKEQSPDKKCQGTDFKQWTNCTGTFNDEDGHKYIGQFKNGKIVKGTTVYPDGSKYKGSYKAGKRNGQGVLIYADGSKYDGSWKNGNEHGHGVKTWVNGKEYIGNFKNNEPHGLGTFVYANGSKYYGDYKNGKRHGLGTLTYSDGRKYKGEFVNGEEYGPGECINLDGLSIKCKVLKMVDKKVTSQNNRQNIFSKIDKWVKISEYENGSGKGGKIIQKLIIDFDKKSRELCSSAENFVILEKRVEVIDLDETPAFGLETVVKLGIVGLINCK